MDPLLLTSADEDSAKVAGATPYGLGLLAAREIQPGEVAVSVPASCLLSAERLDGEPALKDLHDAVPSDFWAARLALILLAERAKGDDAPLAEYVRTLPAAFTVPLMWSPDAVGVLQYPTVQRRLIKSARFVSSFARRLIVLFE